MGDTQGEKQLWTGPCIGGPMGIPGTSQQGQSRYPKGFLYVDKPNKLAWIYEWDEHGNKFFVRNEDPMPFDYQKFLRARDEFDYDIRTAEVEVSRGYQQHHLAQRTS